MATVSKHLTRVALPVVIMLVALALASWFIFSRPRAMPKPPQEQVWPVAVVTANARDVRPEIVVFGEIRAGRETEIRAMVAGRLVYIDPIFKDGSRLEAGMALARIDPVDFENRLAEQRAELARAGALLTEYQRELEWERQLHSNATEQVELAARALARTEKLQKSGRESRKVRDEAATALAQAKQNLLQREQAAGRLRARISQQQAVYEKSQATLALSERELARTQVTAPFDGYVTDVQLALGKLVNVGESLGRLLSVEDVEARFDLPEAAFSRLLNSAGGEAAPSTDALLKRDVTLVWHLGESVQRFPARIVRIGAEIDATLGGIEITASVEPSALDQGLRVGAFVEVRVPDVLYTDVFQLPAQALSEGQYIYVIRDERLVRVAAQAQGRIGDEILVRAEVDEGESIVARVFAGIGPGLKVRPL